MHGAPVVDQVVVGTPRDSLNVLDVLYDQDGGTFPKPLVRERGVCLPDLRLLSVERGEPLCQGPAR
jgi:hypothetical protein